MKMSKKKLNVCLISNEYPPETGFGGIGTYTYELSHGLKKLGHKVIVLSSGNRFSDTLEEGIRVIRLENKLTANPVLDIPLREIIPASSSYFFRSLWVCNYLKYLVEKEQIDIIEGADWGAEILLYTFLKKRVKVFVKLHTPYVVLEQYLEKYYQYNWLDRKIVIWFEKLLVKKSDGIISASKALADEVQKSYKINRQIKIIPNGLNTKIFIPNNTIQHKNLLFVGRLEVNKGICILIQGLKKIFQEVKDFQCLIIGRDTPTAPDNSGSMKKYLQKMISKYNIESGKLVFIDHIERSELIKYYQSAYLGVFPSLWENCPYTVLESLACGLPVIASNTGGLKEIVQQGCGVLFERENYNELAQKITGLIKNRKVRNKMSHKAVLRIKNKYNSLAMAKQTLKYYEN